MIAGVVAGTVSCTAANTISTFPDAVIVATVVVPAKREATGKKGRGKKKRKRYLTAKRRREQT